MFCSHCGANNDNASRNCIQCGSPIVGPPQSVAVNVQQPVAPPPMYSVPPAIPGTPLPAGTVPNYLVQSILVTLCCCLPLGIVGIVKSGEVNNRLAVGDYEGALKASRSIRTILWIGVASGIILCIVYGIIGFVGGLSHLGHSMVQ